MLQSREGAAANTGNKSGFQPSFLLAEKEELRLYTYIYRYTYTAIYTHTPTESPTSNSVFTFHEIHCIGEEKKKSKKKPRLFHIPTKLGSCVIALTRTELQELQNTA